MVDALPDTSGLLPNMLNVDFGGEVWVVDAVGEGIDPNMLPVDDCVVGAGAANPLKGDALTEGAPFVIGAVLEKPLFEVVGAGLAELTAG